MNDLRKTKQELLNMRDHLLTELDVRDKTIQKLKGFIVMFAFSSIATITYLSVKLFSVL